MSEIAQWFGSHYDLWSSIAYTFVVILTVLTAVLIDHSRMTARRIQEYLHLRYRDIDKVQAIVTDTNRMLSEHPGISTTSSSFVSTPAAILR